MSLTAQQLADLADLNSGRGPVWTAPVIAPSVPPTTLAPGTEGLATQGATLTQVAVRLRLDPLRLAVTLDLDIDLTDTGREYEFNLDAQNYTITPTSLGSNLGVLTEIALAINAGSTHSAAPASQAATETHLRVWRDDGVAIGTVTPVQNTTLVGRDATDATVRVWGRSSTLPGWFVVGQSEGLELTANWVDAIRTSGLDALYVQVTSESPDALIYVSVGPCLGEGTA